jgi:hypothetical protein
MGPMNSKKNLIVTVLLSLYFFLPVALADTVHLKNGNAIKVEKSWQEDGQVWFIFHGMKASLPQSKVVRIEKGAGHRAKRARLENHSTIEITAARPQPAKKTLPPQIIKTAGTSAASQQLPLSTKKALVLCKDGLADMKWGATRATVRGLEIKQTDSGLKDVIEYVRPNDSLKLGGATLITVVYAFWRDQLYTVSIWTQGREDFKALRDPVFKVFGKGTRIDGSGEKYLWSNSSTDIMLKYTSDDQYGLLWMRDKKLDRKLKLSQLNGHTSYLKRMTSIR